MVVWLALACSTPDPALAAKRHALDAWQEGSALLDQGDAAGARHKFEEASGYEPDDGLLIGWQAVAAARAGDLDGAIALADRALMVRPGMVELRYDRATWHARRGDIADAATDLDVAMHSGLNKLPRDIRDDPDFADVLDEPAFATLLPVEPLSVAVEGPTGAVFLGSDFPVRLRVAGAGDDPIGVTAEEASGPAALIEVLEDELPSTEGPFRDITWRFQATGSGTITMGPFHVYAGPRNITVAAVTVEAKAPPGRQDPPGAGIRFTTPRELTTRRSPPVAFQTQGDLVVMYLPGDRVELTPALADLPVRYELRRRSQTVWTADQYLGDASAVRNVKIVRSGETVFDGSPLPPG
jgi:hypothetical protein